MLVDGPFTETKEALGGFYLIDCETRAEAVDWAKKVPLAHRQRARASVLRGQAVGVRGGSPVKRCAPAAVTMARSGNGRRDTGSGLEEDTQ